MGRASRCEDIYPFVKRLIEDRVKLWAAISARREPKAGGQAVRADNPFDVALLEQLKRMHEDLAEANQFRVAAVQEGDELRARIFEISGELLSEHRSSETAWERLDAAQRENERVLTDNTRLQESLRALQADLEAIERSRSKVREQLAESLTRSERLVEDSRAVCSQRDQLHRDLASANRSQDALEQNLQRRTRQCQELQGAIKRVVKQRRSERRRFSAMLTQRPIGRVKAHSVREQGQVIPLPAGKRTTGTREDERPLVATIASQDETIRKLQKELEDRGQANSDDGQARAELARTFVEWLPAGQRANYRAAGCDIHTLLRLAKALNAA
jgi:hypothetical protein